MQKHAWIMLAALGLFALQPAKAATYDWTVDLPSGPGTTTGSGQLVTSDTLSNSYDGNYTGYQVTSFTGTYDNISITGLLSGDSYEGNDNLINSPAPFLDADGLAFTLAKELKADGYDTSDVRLYVFNKGYTDSGADTSTAADGFTLTLVPSAVPEPASLLLLAPALFGLILLRRAGLRRGAYRTPA